MCMARRGATLGIPALVLLALGWTTHAQQPRFVPVTDAVLQDPEPADRLRWRRDNGASGFSPLDQMTRENVGGLRLAWSWAMASGLQEPEPIVYRGVMYVPHTQGVVQALDARTGDLIWEYRRSLPDGMGADMTRNLALYEDKVYLTTEDAYLVALAATTGHLVWEIKNGDPGDRLNYSAGPIARWRAGIRRFDMRHGGNEPSGAFVS
jgi:alcohol dehydrogenase (cytochrome c)